MFPPFSIFGGLWRGPFGGNMSSPDEHIDRDLDSEVEMGTRSLDDILDQKDKGQMLEHVPRSSSSSSSFSSVTVVDSNGVSERRTTRKDSTGKEEVTIARKIGDQTHTFTRRKDESGNEETREDLVNIDDGDLEKFNEKWHSKRQGKHTHLSDGNSSSSRHTPLSSVYESVLEQFFPRR